MSEVVAPCACNTVATQCPICGKDLIKWERHAVGDQNHREFDEPTAHALEHLSSEARRVAGMLVALDAETVREIVAGFCSECGSFNLAAGATCVHAKGV